MAPTRQSGGWFTRIVERQAIHQRLVVGRFLRGESLSQQQALAGCRRVASGWTVTIAVSKKPASAALAMPASAALAMRHLALRRFAPE